MTNKFQITSLLRGQSSRMNKEPQATTNQISSTKKKQLLRKNLRLKKHHAHAMNLIKH